MGAIYAHSLHHLPCLRPPCIQPLILRPQKGDAKCFTPFVGCEKPLRSFAFLTPSLYAIIHMCVMFYALCLEHEMFYAL